MNETPRTDRELLELALEALEADNSKLWPSEKRSAAIKTLRAALARAEAAEKELAAHKRLNKDLESESVDAYAQRDKARAELTAAIAERDALRAALGMMLKGTEPTAGKITMPTANAVRAAYAALAEPVPVMAPWMIKPVACWCMTCDEAANGFRSRMSLCPECGDKRCRRAEFHGNECSAPDVAEPVQEPVAWMIYTQDGKSAYVTDNPADIGKDQQALALYTAPPAR